LKSFPIPFILFIMANPFLLLTSVLIPFIPFITANPLRRYRPILTMEATMAVARMMLALLALFMVSNVANGQPLDGTQPLTMQGDLAAAMVGGIDRYLTGLTTESIANRAGYWKRDYSSWAAYSRSIEPNRERFKRILGLTD